MTATKGTKGHCVLRKYVITVVPQMAELAISGPVCAKIALRIVLDQKLASICTAGKMPTTNLATSATTMVHVAMLQENARVLWMEKSMQTVVKTKNTQHAPHILAVLVNASTRRIVSAMRALLESVVIPGYAQKIAIGMNSDHKANAFMMKKVK